VCVCVFELVMYLHKSHRFRRTEHLALDMDLSVSGKPFIGLISTGQGYTNATGHVYPYTNIILLLLLYCFPVLVRFRHAEHNARAREESAVYSIGLGTQPYIFYNTNYTHYYAIDIRLSPSVIQFEIGKSTRPGE